MSHASSLENLGALPVFSYSNTTLSEASSSCLKSLSSSSSSSSSSGNSTITFGTLPPTACISHQRHARSTISSLTSWALLASSSSHTNSSSSSVRSKSTLLKSDSDYSVFYAALRKMNDSFLLLLEDGQSQNNPHPQPQHDHASVHVARGLTNRGNACYMNAVLQLLMGISPFFTALKSLPYYTQIPESCPFTRCCVELCGLYHEAQKNEIKVASSVTPSMFYDLFSKLGPKSHFYSILYSVQEDAVEFCTYLLNALHTEAAESVQSQSSKKKSGGGEKEVTMEKNEDQEGWNRVTKGKRSEKVDSSVTFGLSSTYVSSLFVGCQQLVLRKAGSGVSVQEQPFFVLPVDISDTRIKSVEDGLRALSASNTIEGYMHNGVPVACSQQTVISSLPPVLFIQLQRFLYWGADAEKNSRMITYSDRLVLPAQSCVASAAPLSMRTYRLHGVMTHVGEQAGAGHYVVDVKYGNKWLCFDDELVTPVSNEAAVNRLAYLLVYVREP